MERPFPKSRRPVDSAGQSDRSGRARFLFGFDEAFAFHAAERHVHRAASQAAARRLDELQPELRALLDEELEDQALFWRKTWDRLTHLHKSYSK